MNARKLNEIASWLLDRITAGRNEENGSMDWDDFGKTHVAIIKNEDDYSVYLGEHFAPDCYLTESMTFGDILTEIAAA